MVYSRFHTNIIIRVLLLVANVFLLLIAIFIEHWIATAILSAIILILQVTELVRFTDKINRELARFITAIKYRDLSQNFSGENNESSSHELHAAFNVVIEEYRKLGREREAHHQYLQTVVEHVSLGLIAFDKEGEVQLMNKAAKELLNTPYLKNIRGLDKLGTELSSTMKKLRPGDKELVKVSTGRELLHLSIHAAGFRLHEKDILLVSLQNIQNELDEKELDAWQKLIRVLTHEIMNSVTPITSLTGSAISLLEDNGKPLQQADPESIEDVHNALCTIEKRSRGLLDFVDIYRNLTRIPRPHIQPVDAAALIDSVYQLLKKELETKGISFVSNIKEPPLQFLADASLIEQVLINLLLNAMDAVSGKSNAAIEINAFTERGRTIIQVKDNGTGMDEETLANSFVPFYTTKAKGSGIGLSLSQQVMRLHKGSITVLSEKDKGSIFTLKF